MIAWRRHLACLKYTLKHKWYVFLAGIKLGVSLWQGLVHDMSKFLPSEFPAYAECFHNVDGSRRYLETEAFNVAWNSHQKRNKHHHQYWTLIMDESDIISLEMPEKYAREMVADWVGAGKAIYGKNEVKSWYYRNKHKVRLHEKTRELVERLVEEAQNV